MDSCVGTATGGGTSDMQITEPGQTLPPEQDPANAGGTSDIQFTNLTLVGGSTQQTLPSKSVRDTTESIPEASDNDNASMTSANNSGLEPSRENNMNDSTSEMSTATPSSKKRRSGLELHMSHAGSDVKPTGPRKPRPSIKIRLNYDEDSVLEAPVPGPPPVGSKKRGSKGNVSSRDAARLSQSVKRKEDGNEQEAEDSDTNQDRTSGLGGTSKKEEPKRKTLGTGGSATPSNNASRKETKSSGGSKKAVGVPKSQSTTGSGRAGRSGSAGKPMESIESSSDSTASLESSQQSSRKPKAKSVKPKSIVASSQEKASAALESSQKSAQKTKPKSRKTKKVKQKPGKPQFQISGKNKPNGFSRNKS